MTFNIFAAGLVMDYVIDYVIIIVYFGTRIQ